MRAFFAYDLVGLQSEADVGHFRRYMINEANAEDLGAGRLAAFSRELRVGAFPIGMDVQEFERLGRGAEAVQTGEALRAGAARGRSRGSFSAKALSAARAFASCAARSSSVLTHSSTGCPVRKSTRVDTALTRWPSGMA